MIIKRTIDGKEYEFELTSAEMIDTYWEKQEEYDRLDVETWLEFTGNEPVVSDEFVDYVYTTIVEAFHDNNDSDLSLWENIASAVDYVKEFEDENGEFASRLAEYDI